MKPRSIVVRRFKNNVVSALSMASAALGIFFLGWILLVVARHGASAIDWAFLTRLQQPAGVPGGGVANAILGTIMMTLLGAAIGTPVGLMAGIYLSEFGLRGRFGAAARFMANMMMGVPSIVIGLFVYALLVKPMGGFSGYAGGVALALLIMPIVARTTEDMLRLVPNELRESGLALGLPRWRITLNIVFRRARVGVITGVLLAVARVSGETAPLLFTALNSQYWPRGLGEPTANLTVTIFNYAMSPYDDWQRMAWGASLLIMAGVLATTILTRALLKERRG
jgi:phosphate transport system permease protein